MIPQIEINSNSYLAEPMALAPEALDCSHDERGLVVLVVGRIEERARPLSVCRPELLMKDIGSTVQVVQV